MVDVADAYLAVQDRLIESLRDPAVDVRAPVPACPGWHVRDVLAHHVGLVAGVAKEDLGQYGMLSANILEQWRDAEVQQARDAMTAMQVEERRLSDLPTLVAEWRNATAEALPLLRGQHAVAATLPPFAEIVLVIDLVVHETDIRAALGFPRAPASPALSLALAGYTSSLEYRIRALRLPALVLAYDGKERRIGEGPVAATLSADRHELVRILAGRRTPAQILGLQWEGDAAPFVEILSEYGPTDVPGTD